MYGNLKNWRLETIISSAFCKLRKTTFFLILLSGISVFAQKDVFDICRTGSVEELIQLYKEDSNVINTKNDMGYSPLVLACYSGNEAVVGFLVDKVKTVNGSYDYGTPLMAATVKGHTKIVDVLLNHEANPDLTDSKGGTAGHYAVMFKNYDIIKLLVAAKADFNIKNNVGKSAMDFVLSYNDSKLNELFKI